MARSQAPRVTNTTTDQNVNQVLFRVEESMELLSNRVLDLFSSRIDGKINEFVETQQSIPVLGLPRHIHGGLDMSSH